jgi:aspartate aminotransferase
MLKRLGATERSRLMARSLPRDLARLHIGDPFFETPAHICHAALKAMQAGYTHYAPFPGDPQLREAICGFLNSECGLNFQPHELLVTNGATEAIFCAIAGYIDPGDEVLVFDPTYSLYSTCVSAVGGETVSVPLSPDQRLAREELMRRVGPHSKMIIINNPNNPTGTLFSREELKTIAEVAVGNDLLVLSDEVYHRFTYDGAEHVSVAGLPELRERCLVVNSFSKTYAMTGWRVGYLAGVEELVKPILPLHCALTGTVNHPSQKAALAALRGPQGCVEEMRAEYSARRGKMLEGIKSVEGLSCIPPQGAFYVFCKFDFPLTSANLTEELMKRGVAVRSGTEYGPGGEGHIRLAFTAPAGEIEEGMQRLKKTFLELGAMS